MTHSAYQWMLVDDFVDRFNAHRATIFFQVDMFVLMNPLLGGMDMEVIGLIMVSLIIFQLIESLRVVLRFRMPPVGKVV